MKTVHDLRKQGYQVSIMHMREYSEPNMFQDVYLLSKGGATFIQVRLSGAHGAVIGEGEARCHPNENYCKKLGTRIALGRALKQLGLPTK